MAQYDYETNMQDAQSLANMLGDVKYIAKPTIAKVHETCLWCCWTGRLL